MFLEIGEVSCSSRRVFIARENTSCVGSGCPSVKFRPYESGFGFVEGDVLRQGRAGLMQVGMFWSGKVIRPACHGKNEFIVRGTKGGGCWKIGGEGIDDLGTRAHFRVEEDLVVIVCMGVTRVKKNTSSQCNQITACPMNY